MKFVKACAATVALGIASVAVAAETVIYTYDALGRLEKRVVAGGPTTGTTTDIQHDPAGNRLNYKVSASANLPPVPPSVNGKFIIIPLNGFTVIPLP